MTQEKSVQKKLLEFLNSPALNPHVWCVKTIASNKNGVPDIIACILGHFVSFECKGESGKETKLQTYNRKKINLASGTSFVVKPSNLQITKQGVLLFLHTHKMSKKIGVKIDNNS